MAGAGRFIRLGVSCAAGYKALGLPLNLSEPVSSAKRQQQSPYFLGSEAIKELFYVWG